MRPSFLFLTKIGRFGRHFFRSITGLPRDYQLGGFAIMLPANHALWIYQAEHPRYDRFLPHLSRFVKDDEAVIDIGANVGDSVAAMVDANPAPTYICVEADETFYQYLTRNIGRIKSHVCAARIHPIKCLVGKSIGPASMQGAHGTKRAVPLPGGPATPLTLDEITASIPGLPKVRLIKTDVDGFDYDVIDSSMSLIEKDKPLLFFEAHYASENQKVGFEKMLTLLQDRGYSDWVVFDNFGQFMFRTDNISTVAQIMRYPWRQNSDRASRTIYYVDILASQITDRELVDEVLAKY